MKIIEALTYMNPVHTAKTLVEGYRKMSEQEFRAFQSDALARAQEFAKSDDLGFVASLDEAEVSTYASACSSFLKALLEAHAELNSTKAIAARSLASAVAWWHMLENLRTGN